MALAPYAPHHADRLVDIFHRAVHDSASGYTALHVEVSRTAQALFEGLGFRVVRRCHPVRRGQVLPNVAMQKRLS